MSLTSLTIELPGRYRNAQHIATGGMASVWAAEDTVLGRPVAVKVLAERFAEDPLAVRRFMREARAAARVSQHPHVVTIYDVGEHKDRQFIVMELMDGGSLASVLRDGRPSREDALRWIDEAASALDAAHEHQIVHRDVKPGNLLLDRRRRLAVADFGIARLAFESSVTQTGMVLGTAAYVSPEQARGEGATAASDRYALGVVAFELLAGAKPFPGGSFAVQARHHIESDPMPATAHAPELRPEVDGVMQRALAKDPEDRWPTATAFAAALRRACGERPAATDTTATRTLPRPPAPVVPAADRRRRLAPLALVLAGLLVATLAAVALVSGGDDGTAPQRAERSQPPARERTAPAQTDSQPQAPAATPSGGGTESVSSLNDRGFALMNQGRYAEAIPLLQQAAQRCGDSREPVCAYALYNLGRSLRLAGRPAEAIPILERRLGYDNQTETVQAELDAARRAAGVAEAPAAGDENGGDEQGDGPGKGKKKGQRKKD
jgi:serine/threonine protein kinase